MVWFAAHMYQKYLFGFVSKKYLYLWEMHKYLLQIVINWFAAVVYELIICAKYCHGRTGRKFRLRLRISSVLALGLTYE